MNIKQKLHQARTDLAATAIAKKTMKAREEAEFKSLKQQALTFLAVSETVEKMTEQAREQVEKAKAVAGDLDAAEEKADNLLAKVAAKTHEVSAQVHETVEERREARARERAVKERNWPGARLTLVPEEEAS